MGGTITNRDASQILRALGLSREMVEAHVHRPPHVLEAVMRTWPLGSPAWETLHPWDSANRLDWKGFADDLHAAISGNVAGYAMQLRHHGQTVVARQWQSARAKDEGDVGWTPDVPMHVASVSKLITAMATTRALRDAQVSPDATVAPWLPAYWPKGPGVDTLTFRHLLTHTSGLNFGPGPAPNTNPGPADFPFMKAQIAMGTTHIGARCYQNCNFALCRILICTLGGVVAPATTFGVLGIDLNDQFWDLVTINGYRSYVAEKVFAPAGVSAPTLDHPASDALAYTFPAAGAGWDSGDLSTASGGVGWHISVDDLLDVMGAFRRTGSILSVAEAEQMRADGFGFEPPRDVPLGRIHWKGGWWQSSDGKVEQTSAYFLPNDMELVVMVNSPWAGGDVPGRVEAAIRANTHPPYFPIRGVLLAGGFRSQHELNAMSLEDMRNTLIVEMTNHSNQADYQAYDNDTLAGVGAVMVFLRRTGIRDDAALRAMSADAQRNTLIVELDAQTGAGASLQAFTDMQLVLIGLGSDLATRGQVPGAVSSWIRGVLLAGGFRSQHELNAMSHEDMRNTLIVEMTNHSNQTNYQSYNDAELEGVGAVMVLLRALGIRDDAALRAMSADDQRNTLIVELDAQTSFGRDLQAFTNLELVLTALGA